LRQIFPLWKFVARLTVASTKGRVNMSQDEKKPDTTPEAVEGEPQPVKKSMMVIKLAILGIVMGVIGVECGAAYWFLSSTGDATAQASEPDVEEKPAEKSEHKAAKHEGKEEKGGEHGAKSEHGAKGGEHEAKANRDPDEQVEVVLGEFSVTSFQPATNTTIRIEFVLYGTVIAKNQTEFLTALEENQHRFRDQVLKIVRSAEITDLTDAGLGLIKRKIQEATNRMIGKQLLQSIIFSDFSFVEQ
jgi:flagellar FliL protein